MEKGISFFVSVLKRRSMPALAAFAAVFAGAGIYLAVTPRMYETSARLMLDDKRASVSELGRDLTQVSSNTPGGPSPLADQAELVKSQRVLKRAIQIFQESNNTPQIKLTTEDLNKNLKVKIVPATNILELNYQSKDPKFAARIVNAVSQAMERESADTIRQEAENVRKFLYDEVPKARNRVEEAERQENKYRQTSGIVSFDEQTKSLVESLANLEEQERTLSAQLKDVRSRDASLRKITDTKAVDKAYASVRGGQDDQLKELRTKLTELETKLVEVRARFTEDHPNVQNLINQRDTVRKLYLEGLNRVFAGNKAVSPGNVAGDQLSQNLTSQFITNDIERQAVENKLTLVVNERKNLQQRLAELPEKQRQLTPLVRKREEAAQSLKLLQAKYEEARIAVAQKVGNIRIIEAAQAPTVATSPQKKAVLAIATMFGTILATGIVLLLEVLDNTLKDASEAEELLKLPLLGVLPRLPGRTLILEPADRFLDDVGLVEPYRMLFKTLEFRNSEAMRLIVVSSTISGEGKSIVASHLAAISAMLSRRTLIIDADLRRPVQHTLFNLPPKPGISDVIDGEKSLLEAVQSTEIENLSVLTCGELRGRPSQLLESAAMKSMLAEAAAKYDVVIVDTPPLSACADAASLSRQSDGVILVTRPSFTLKEVLSRTVSQLTRNHIPILGVVVNGITDTTEQYYRYPMRGEQPTRRLTGLDTNRNQRNDSRYR